MATIEQLESALRKADAAGAADDARALAAEIRRVRGASKADFSDVSATVSATPSKRAEYGGFAGTDKRVGDLVSGPKQRRATYNFTGVPGVSTQIGGFLDAAQHHGMGALHGAAQLIEHGVNSAANLLPEDNSVRGYVNRTVASDDAAMRQREAEYQARTEGNAMSYPGAVAGEVLPFMAAAPARALGAIGQGAAKLLPASATLGRKVVSGAAQGAAIGAVQPVIGEGSYADQKAMQVGAGGVTGGVIPAAAAGVRGSVDFARHIVAPGSIARENLVRNLGADAGTVGQLRNAPQYVPGEAPTTAQVLANPRAVQTEKALRNNPEYKPQFEDIDNANNAARLDVLRRLGGTDDELMGAVQARRVKAREFADTALAPGAENQRYARAAKLLQDFGNSKSMPMSEFKIVDEARKIMGQVQRGTLDEKEGAAALAALNPTSRTVKRAIEQATAAVDQNMVPVGRIQKQLQQLSLSGNPTVSGAAKRHLSLLAEHADSRGKVPAYALDDIRQNIGKMLSGNAPNGVVGSQEAALYAPISSKIVSTLDRSVPGYRDYLSAYREGSVPINTMETARRILAPVDQRGLNSAGDSRLTLPALNTGLNRADKSRFGLAPQARQEVEGVRQSLQRESVSNSLRSAGSDTNFNAQSQGWLARQMLGETLQGPTNTGRGLAALIGGTVGAHLGGPAGAAGGAGASLLLKKSADVINKRIMDRYAAGMKDPQEAARMIEQFLAQNPKEAPLLLKQYPQWAALIGQEPL